MNALHCLDAAAVAVSPEGKAQLLRLVDQVIRIYGSDYAAGECESANSATPDEAPDCDEHEL